MTIVLMLTVHFVLVAVFASAIGFHLKDQGAMPAALAELGLPRWLAGVTLVAEAAACILLVLMTRVGAAVVGGYLTCVTIPFATAWIRRVDIDGCGCFGGRLGSLVGRGLVIRNTALLAGAITLAIGPDYSSPIGILGSALLAATVGAAAYWRTPSGGGLGVGVASSHTGRVSSTPIP